MPEFFSPAPARMDLTADGGEGAELIGDQEPLPKILTWNKLETIGFHPAARQGHTSVTRGLSTYIFGGHEAGKRVNSVTKLDVTNCSWKLLPSQGDVPPERSYHAACVCGNYMVVHGGEAEIYKPDTVNNFGDGQVLVEADTDISREHETSEPRFMDALRLSHSDDDDVDDGDNGGYDERSAAGRSVTVVHPENCVLLSSFKRKKEATGGTSRPASAGPLSRTARGASPVRSAKLSVTATATATATATGGGSKSDTGRNQQQAQRRGKRTALGPMFDVCPGDSIGRSREQFKVESPKLYCLKDMYAYSLSNQTWIRIHCTLAPLPRKGHTLVPAFITGSMKLLLFGGYSIANVSLSNSVQVCEVEDVIRYARYRQELLTLSEKLLSRSSNSVSRIRSRKIDAGRSSAREEERGGEEGAAGGGGDGGRLVESGPAVVWRTLQCGGQAPSPRYRHSCTVVENGSESEGIKERLMVVIGGIGADPTTALNDIHILNLDTLQWSTPRMPSVWSASDLQYAPVNGVYGHCAIPVRRRESKAIDVGDDLAKEELKNGTSEPSAGPGASVLNKFQTTRFASEGARSIGTVRPASASNIKAVRAWKNNQSELYAAKMKKRAPQSAKSLLLSGGGAADVSGKTAASLIPKPSTAPMSSTRYRSKGDPGQEGWEILVFGGSSNPIRTNQNCRHTMSAFDLITLEWRKIPTGYKFPSARNNFSMSIVHGWAPEHPLPFQQERVVAVNAVDGKRPHNQPVGIRNPLARTAIIFAGVDSVRSNSDTWALDLTWHRGDFSQFDNSYESKLLNLEQIQIQGRSREHGEEGRKVREPADARFQQKESLYVYGEEEKKNGHSRRTVEKNIKNSSRQSDRESLRKFSRSPFLAPTCADNTGSIARSRSHILTSAAFSGEAKGEQQRGAEGRDEEEREEEDGSDFSAGVSVLNGMDIATARQTAESRAASRKFAAMRDASIHRSQQHNSQKYRGMAAKSSITASAPLLFPPGSENPGENPNSGLLGVQSEGSIRVRRSQYGDGGATNPTLTKTTSTDDNNININYNRDRMLNVGAIGSASSADDSIGFGRGIETFRITDGGRARYQTYQGDALRDVFCRGSGESNGCSGGSGRGVRGSGSGGVEGESEEMGMLEAERAMIHLGNSSSSSLGLGYSGSGSGDDREPFGAGFRRRKGLVATQNAAHIQPFSEPSIDPLVAKVVATNKEVGIAFLKVRKERAHAEILLREERERAAAAELHSLQLQEELKRAKRDQADHDALVLEELAELRLALMTSRAREEDMRKLNDEACAMIQRSGLK